MARIKTISDDALLDRLLGVLMERGPAGLTFANGAKAVGLSGSTLVQRFGTRDAMIEAILLRAWYQLEAATAAADRDLPLSPAGAIDLLISLMPPEKAEENATDGLLLLREDIRNPLLRARGAAWGRQLATALGRRLTSHADEAERLGWQMATVWQGAHIWWAFTRDKPAESALRQALQDWCRTIGID
ncbi:MAG: TetR/AcrR family transcriptional regulator [Rhizobium sp.]|nr:TetR/AcrR family transcriptional regulator [Rhizobium sp.]